MYIYIYPIYVYIYIIIYNDVYIYIYVYTCIDYLLTGDSAVHAKFHSAIHAEFDAAVHAKSTQPYTLAQLSHTRDMYLRCTRDKTDVLAIAAMITCLQCVTIGAHDLECMHVQR